jgi:mRNA interferase RelE/StbE
MKYTIKFRPAVEKNLRTIPQKDLIRIKRKIDALAENLPDQAITKMKGNNNFHKRRTGDYRIIYCETQISKTKYIEICKSNNPDTSGGYHTPNLEEGLESKVCPRGNTRDEIHNDTLVILVVKIGHRKDIYKKLP